MGDGNGMFEILYEDNHLLGIVKPCNMPVQEDESKDLDVLRYAKQYLKETYQKPGNVYVGLVHRLDRPVGGVMVLAKTSKAASRLTKAMQENQFQKTYLAILDGIPPKQEDTLIDYLYKDTKTNTVTVSDQAHGKYAELSYQVLATHNNHALVQIHLVTGRSHQIRVQFSSRGYPLLNDQCYHPSPKKGPIGLWAYQLSFPHPTTKEIITLKAIPPMEQWKEFEVNVL